MTEAKDEKPRIIVDSDWKEEVRREKEQLDRETRDIPQAGELPEAHIAEIVQVLAMQASIALGGYQDPATGQTIPPHLPSAKHYIDLLGVFQQKTRGNLDDTEQKLVDQTLHELRIAFVHVTGAGSAPPGSPASKDKPAAPKPAD